MNTNVGREMHYNSNFTKDIIETVGKEMKQAQKLTLDKKSTIFTPSS